MTVAWAPDGAATGGDSLSILHLVAPAPVGGIESVIRTLAAGQQRAGHAVRVAAILGAPDEAAHPWLEQLAADGIETVALHHPGRRYRRERRAVEALCRELAPSVVHTHGYRPDVIGAAGARAAGVATLTTVHGFTGGDWKNRLYERLQLRAFRRFDAVVAVSSPLRDRLALAGVPDELLHVVPNAYAGHRPPLAPDVARAELGVPRGVFSIGWVGRLGREKGADVLLEALALLAERELVVSIVGDGREMRALRTLASDRGLADRVHFHGLVPDAGRHVRAFDLFVMSSRTEGTPIVLFEAMAAGVPVVATAVGGIPDVVSGEEARLVPPEDPAMLASAIATVLRDRPAAARRAERARHRLTTEFAVEPWLRRYEALYRSIRRSPAPTAEALAV